MHRLQHIDHTRHISTSSKSPGCYGGFENRAEFSTAHPFFFFFFTITYIVGGFSAAAGAGT